jgi:UDP-glucose 4-epimerase
MEKVLVTGGAGFIGSHLSECLNDRGYGVVVLDDLSGGFEENVVEGVRFIKGSINDVDLVNRIFAEERFDIVCHLAAYAAEGLSHFIKRFNYSNNLIGSVNLINASLNWDVRCFLFTSSIAVYGTHPNPPITEDAPVNPEDPYGIAKVAVEQELQVSHDMFGMDYIIFRPHNVYGERQNIGDKYRNVVGIFMNQILQGKPMTVFGDGTQTRAFSYIRDIVPVMADALENPSAINEIFNVGADQPFTINELAVRVAEAMEVLPEISYLPARNEVLNAYSSHAKVEHVFGKRKLHTLEEGLRRTATWVRKHGARKSQGFENIEVRKNFPVAWSS